MRLHRHGRDPMRRHHLLLHVRRDTQQCQLLCVTKYQSGEAVQVTGRPLLIDNETECRTENITPGSTDFLLKYCIAENKE